MLRGHSHIQESFERLIGEGGLRHAYLFFGDEGIGKSLFAHSLARRIECGSFGETDTPLTDLSVCAISEKGTIGIEEVRALRAFLWQTPFHSPRRTVIVDDAGRMTPEAQGALLKIVEEPPAHGLVILVAHDVSELLPPLVSRTARIHFKRMPREELKDALIDAFGVPPVRAEQIAARSFGSLGRALLLLRGPLPAPAEEDGKLVLERDLEAEILARYEEDPIRHAPLIGKLVARAASLKQYNLNPNLQRKAVEYETGDLYT